MKDEAELDLHHKPSVHDFIIAILFLIMLSKHSFNSEGDAVTSANHNRG